MKLANAFSILKELWLVFCVGLFPTLKEIGRKPSLLLHPIELRRVFMMYIWPMFGEGIEQHAKEVKQDLITRNAYGVIFEIGAGHGHTANHLDKEKVKQYIALEPNVHFHSEIRKRANAAGYTEESGTFQVIPCGAEDIDDIVSRLPGGRESVDTLISILTLCSIPNPEKCLSGLVSEVLKPGGTFLYYEHVKSSFPDVAWWQSFWSPIWALALDGCRLDCPSHLMVAKLGYWNTEEVWNKPGEENAVDHMFPHKCGKYTKKASA